MNKDTRNIIIGAIATGVATIATQQACRYLDGLKVQQAERRLTYYHGDSRMDPASTQPSEAKD